MKRIKKKTEIEPRTKTYWRMVGLKKSEKGTLTEVGESYCVPTKPQDALMLVVPPSAKMSVVQDMVAKVEATLEHPLVVMSSNIVLMSAEGPLNADEIQKEVDKHGKEENIEEENSEEGKEESEEKDSEEDEA